MNKKHYTKKRKALLAYLFDLAAIKGISQDTIAERTGFDKSNVSRMKKGMYSPSLDNLMCLADAIGHDVAFINKMVDAKIPDAQISPKFLLAIDNANSELYILHRHWPSCLIWVKQENPVRFIVQDLYDELDNRADILNMSFIEEAKAFFRENAESFLDHN